jgi:hypothetical protein
MAMGKHALGRVAAGRAAGKEGSSEWAKWATSGEIKYYGGAVSILEYITRVATFTLES